MKRIIDCSISFLGLLILSPILITVAIWIRRDSPGSAIYKGLRSGKDGKTFEIYKFRTMHDSAGCPRGPVVTSSDDSRVTTLGRWLRLTKINELPQLWNVLKGDMSLVGPRPEDPEIVAKWPRDVRKEILSIRPGITSPASILYRKEEVMLKGPAFMKTYMETILPSKQRLDLLYVRNSSLLVDIDVLFWTITLVFLRVREYSPPEGLLFLGPVSRFFRRYLNWFVVDAFMMMLGLAAAGLMWRVQGPLNVGIPKAAGLAIGYSLIFSLTGAIFGVQRISWRQANVGDAVDLLMAAGISTGLTLGANYWLSRPVVLLPMGMIIVGSIIASVFSFGLRYRGILVTALLRRLNWISSKSAKYSDRAIIIGAGATGQFASLLFRNDAQMQQVKLAGFVDDDFQKQGTRVSGVPLLGRCVDLPRLAKVLDVGVLIMAIHNASPSRLEQIQRICLGTGAKVIEIPDIMATLSSLIEYQRDDDTDEHQVIVSWSPYLNGTPSCEWIADDLDALDDMLKSGENETATLKIAALKARISARGPSDPGSRAGRNGGHASSGLFGGI